MKKEVTTEVAIILKDKGYRWKTLKYFKFGSIFRDTILQWDIPVDYNDGTHKHRVSVPTLNDVKDWFRIEKHIRIHIEWMPEDQDAMCYYPVIKYEDENRHHKHIYKRIVEIDENGIGMGYGYYDTHEEALLEGIKIALKLI